MCLCRRFWIKASHVTGRRYTTATKTTTVELEGDVTKQIYSKEMSIRRHPGIFVSQNVSLPTRITEAVKVALADVPVKGVIGDASKLRNYLRSRHAPPEDWQMTEKRSAIYKQIQEKEGIDLEGKSNEEIEEYNRTMIKKTMFFLKQRVFEWKPVVYDEYACLKYLVGRAPAEYAVILRLFQEIRKRNEGYQPTSFFDFGSGVGTGTWAVNKVWGNAIKEYFTVDTSSKMNDLARKVLCDGADFGEVPFPKYFQRQFLPATPTKYDIVLCAYSLFELPSAQVRLQTILNLWRKAKDYLVIIEQGTNAGYQLVNEARDFLLETKEPSEIGHVYSPCPHDKACPRFFQDNTPCNFLVTYGVMNLKESNEYRKELYSYVVMKKGVPAEGVESWPRIVRPTLVKSKHSICRMCCNDGQLKEITFTKKRHGTPTYHCARSSSWGDLLPIKMSPKLDLEEPSTVNATDDSVLKNEIINKE